MSKGAVQTERNRRMAPDPEWRRRAVENCRRLAQNTKWQEAIRRRSQNPSPKEIQRNQKLAERNRRQWQDLEWRKKMKNLYREPEWLRKNAMGARKRAQNPEQQNKMKEIAKRIPHNQKWRDAVLTATQDYECRRKHSEEMRGRGWVGEKHPNWNGGSSFWPYCPLFNEKFKEETRQKFRNVCFVCGAPQNGTKLHVHHIHYDKAAGCNGKGLECVPLCQPHHSMTGALGYRPWWIAYFEQRLWNVFGWHLDPVVEETNT